MAFNAPIFSQVKYTSSGNFGIGTVNPYEFVHYLEADPIILIESTIDHNSTLRFAEGGTSYRGVYFQYQGDPNKFIFGTHISSGKNLSDDLEILKISRNTGRIDFYPQSTSNYDKTFATYTKNRLLENLVVYERTGTNPDVFTQRFCVQGRGQVYCTAVTETSDISLKENISDISNSMALINQLRPVRYNLKAELGIDGKEREVDFGLIAQEVETVIPEAVSENSEGVKGINYREISVLLIDAVKSQQKEIEQLKEEMASFSNSDKKSLEENTSLNSITNEVTLLHQNIPNPFNENTEIKYFIPEGSQRAILFVFNMQGELIKQSELFGIGEGSYILNGSELLPGMYIYSLVIDDKEMASKRMILTE